LLRRCDIEPEVEVIKSRHNLAQLLCVTGNFALPAMICFSIVVTPIISSSRSVRVIVTDALAESDVWPFE